MTNNLPPPPKKPTPPPAGASKPSRMKKVGDAPSHARIVLNCVSGFGKTTIMAHAQDPVLVLAPEESGFLSLRYQGMVPDVPIIQAESWKDLLSILRSEDFSDRKTICIDAISSFATSLRMSVRKQYYDDNPEKYVNFGKGENTAGAESLSIVPELERLARKHDVIVGCHPGTHKYKNQDGEEYHIHAGDVPKLLWESLKRWSDASLYGTFYTGVDSSGKPSGGVDRIFYTKEKGTIDAKDHYGMPPMLKVNGGPETMYDTIFSYIHKKGSK